ncbi:MAG: glycosyltransferase family 2 protein [Clostridiales bacterium]|nr:glycosyltransferase family 2 protein [Clostridiales bacterium]
MISILLASYNGEKYIAEQIDSLLGQTVQDFKLYICDDQSTDSTFSIALQFAEKYPAKIFAMQNKQNSGSAKHNFMKMMIAHKDDYVMLCDQDDIWMPDKIEKSLKKMKEMEKTYELFTPILVHSDLKVVDENLRVISSSHRKRVNADVEKTSLNNVIAMNTVTGCAAIYNRALSNLILVEPDFMVMHDWWLAITAAALGKIGTIDEPTVLYRQHDNNDIGSKKTLSFDHTYYFLRHIDTMASNVNDSYKQAGSFLHSNYERLTEEQRDLLKAFASMSTLSKINRLRTMLKYKTFKQGFTKKVANIIILLIERSAAN